MPGLNNPLQGALPPSKNQLSGGFSTQKKKKKQYVPWAPIESKRRICPSRPAPLGLTLGLESCDKFRPVFRSDLRNDKKKKIKGKAKDKLCCDGSFFACCAKRCSNAFLPLPIRP